jgi:hypothetical protein
MTATQPLIFRKAERVEIAPQIKLPPRVSFVLRNDRKLTLKEFCSEMHQVVSQHKDKNIMIELNTILTARTVYASIFIFCHTLIIDNVIHASDDVKLFQSCQCIQLLLSFNYHTVHPGYASALPPPPAVQLIEYRTGSIQFKDLKECTSSYSAIILSKICVPRKCASLTY